MCCMNTTIAADRNNFKVTFQVAFCEVRYLADGVLPIFMSFAAISSGFMFAVSRPCHLLEFYPGEYVDDPQYN